RVTHDAFLQAIIEAPEDDTPRLVYADWLDDHGEPERAEFIRTQIELARLPEDDPRRLPLEGQEADLLQDHSEEWLGPFAHLVDLTFEDQNLFRRGFLEDVAVEYPTLLDHADELFRLSPVRRIFLHQFNDEPLEGVADLPCLARLTGLEVRHDIRTD